MKYKILVTDIDDTLLNRKKQITEKTKDAIRRAQNAGVKFVVASGRLTYGVRPYAKALDIFSRGGYYMSFNGGKVMDSRDRCIFSHNLDNMYFPKVYEALREYPVTTLVHKDDVIYADNVTNDYTFVEPEAVGLPINRVDDLNSFIDWELHKILVAGDPELLVPINDRLNKMFSKELDIYISAPWFLDIMPKGVSKGEGLKIIAENEGVSQSEIIACGDSQNDISMIEAAGLGVAVQNADSLLKQSADYVTENDCDNDPIAEVIDKFIF